MFETLVTSVGGFRIENIKFTLVTFSPYFIRDKDEVVKRLDEICKPGDSLAIYYSGHGTISDNDKVELESGLGAESKFTGINLSIL